jgi:hypothetical protein
MGQNGRRLVIREAVGVELATLIGGQLYGELRVQEERVLLELPEVGGRQISTPSQGALAPYNARYRGLI